MDTWIVLGRDVDDNNNGERDHLFFVPYGEGPSDDERYRDRVASCGYDITEETIADSWTVITEYDDEWRASEWNKYICPDCLSICNHHVTIDPALVRAAAKRIIKEELGMEA